MMKTFVVIVSCLNPHNCPIPQGYRSELPAPSVATCEKVARDVIGAYGFKTKDFAITCKDQTRKE